MKVLCISGKARAGKDTFAENAKEFLELAGYKVLVTHYADLLKYMCKTFFNWDGNKDERGRKLLQYVGTDLIRKSNPDFWVDFIIQVLELFPEEWDYVIIPDCRFENELNKFKEKNMDMLHIRIERLGYESSLTEEQQNHPSETALDNVKPDYWFLNTGSKEAYKENIGYFFLRTLEVI